MRPELSDSRPTITDVTATGMMARNSVPSSSFCRMDWAPKTLGRAMLLAHELIEEVRVIEFEPGILAGQKGIDQRSGGRGRQMGRNDARLGREHHAPRQTVDGDAGGRIAVADHQQHAF